MKRIVSIIILLTLFNNIIGYYVVLTFQQEETKATVINDIPKSGYQEIHLSKIYYSFYEDTDSDITTEKITLRKKDNLLSYLHTAYNKITKKDLSDIEENILFDNPSKNNNPIKIIVKSFGKDYIPNESLTSKLYIIAQLDCKSCISKPNVNLLEGYKSPHYQPPRIA